MLEKTKFDLFMDELASLEKKIYLMVQKNNQLNDNYKEVFKENELLKKENEILKIKLEEIESKGEISSSNLNILKNIKDKEQFKKNIDELVRVIDYHLRS